MKTVAKALVFTASFALSSSIAFADCAQELAALEAKMGGDNHEGIAKDGSLAPLQKQTDDSSSPAPNDKTSAEDAEVGKATSAGEHAVAPTDSKPSETAGADAAQAMSGQDAQSQQGGGATAAQQAQGISNDGGSPKAASHEDAMANARAALEAGDEEACIQALEDLS